MLFSYRARQRYKWLLNLLLYILAALLIVVLCLLLWVQRFIVYTPQGVRLDFSVIKTDLSGSLPQAPDRENVDIQFSDTSPTQPTETQPDPGTDLPPETPASFNGYFIDTNALKGDIDQIYTQLDTLPAGTPVMLDVKIATGYFLYSSAYGTPSSSYNTAKIDELIRYLLDSELYVIARFPALRDNKYALEHVKYGLADTRGYLWVDSSRIYWLDPTHDGTLTYLIQIIKELRTLGFDEVVLQNFYVPEGDTILFSRDRQQVINETAQALVTACGTEDFTVSFVAQSPTMLLPEANSRLYLMDIPAADVAEILAQMQVNDLMTDVVLIAQSYDTRYEGCGLLHPLSQAH